MHKIYTAKEVADEHHKKFYIKSVLSDITSKIMQMALESPDKYITLTSSTDYLLKLLYNHNIIGNDTSWLFVNTSNEFYKELLKLGFSIEVENHNLIIKW